MIPMCFSLNDVNSEILWISVQLDVQTIGDRLKIELGGGMVGQDGLEPSTLRLSGVRSNHLSY